MEDGSIVIFGAGKIAERVYERIGQENIAAVIDNNVQRQGELFKGTIRIISLDEYIKRYYEKKILIASMYVKEIEEQLKSKRVYNYDIAVEVFKAEDVKEDEDIGHTKWRLYLKQLCDKPGMEVLEIGSRVVTGSCFRELFTNANYTGFDYYPGNNVDVVGDAHQLSAYFDKRFDLIFSSAVFEHLAMPWQVSLEIIKLLKWGGFIFVETHYSYSSHERPWHFFQYSENALHILFPEKFGIKCLKKGCSNLIEGKFSEEAADYLKGKAVPGLYCHSGFLGQKVKEVGEKELSWSKGNVLLEDVVGSTKYPLEEQQ